MKNLMFPFILSAFLLTSINIQARKPIVFSMDADNGRRDFFYDRVVAIPGHINYQEGFWQFCNDPGWTICRVSYGAQGNGGIFFSGDSIDQNNFDALLNFAEQQISLGNLVGTYQVRIRVAGENVDRVYLIDGVSSNNGGYNSTLKFYEL